jgi:hypothetical protein
MNPSSLQQQQQAESKKLSQLHWNDKLKKFSVTDQWIGCRYFTQGDLEATNPSSLQQQQQAESKKLSQLRELLEKNLKAPPSSSSSSLGGGAFKRTSLPLRDINKVSR